MAQGEETSGLVIPIVPFTKVHGRLVDTSGAPVPDRKVIVFQFAEDPPSGVPFDRVTTTDADGRFVGRAAPGKAKVWLDSPWTEPVLIIDVPSAPEVELAPFTVPSQE